ncbi:MAG: hypothetical protein JXR34_12190 [Bacteroidales bacterium]|nr:hypothetical protein [Bacteroidales bacterium]
MDFTQQNKVVTQRYEAIEGNIKYGITSTTSDNVVQQVMCEVDETIIEQQVVEQGTIDVPKVVRLGNISLSNGYKNMHFIATTDAAKHVAAFEMFIASITV